MVEKIGINLTNIQNLSAPNFDNLQNLNGIELVNEIPRNANLLTEGYFGIVILLFLSFILFWIFTEKSQFAQFRYSKIRGLGLSITTTNIMGSLMLQIGYMTSYLHFIYLNAIFLVVIVWIILKNPE